jgi:hypothetical protein
LLFVSLPTWALSIAIRAPLYIIGFVLIPYQAHNVEERDSPQYPGRRVLQFRARWMAPWNNPEDGVDGLRGGDEEQAWWGAQTSGDSEPARIFAWSALRNAINGLRYAPILCPRLTSKGVGYVGTGDEPEDGQSGWAYVWQGLYSGLYIKRPTLWLWIGWKLRPSDANGIPPTDTRLPRADFALQLQRVRA